MKSALLTAVLRFAQTLKFGQLFLLTGALFLLDLLIPDRIPFADELLLGLVTLMLGSWKKEAKPPRTEPPDPSRSAGEQPGRVIEGEVTKKKWE